MKVSMETRSYINLSVLQNEARSLSWHQKHMPEYTATHLMREILTQAKAAAALGILALSQEDWEKVWTTFEDRALGPTKTLEAFWQTDDDHQKLQLEFEAIASRVIAIEDPS